MGTFLDTTDSADLWISSTVLLSEVTESEWNENESSQPMGQGIWFLIVGIAILAITCIFAIVIIWYCCYWENINLQSQMHKHVYTQRRPQKATTPKNKGDKESSLEGETTKKSELKIMTTDMDETDADRDSSTAEHDDEESIDSEMDDGVSIPMVGCNTPMNTIVTPQNSMLSKLSFGTISPRIFVDDHTFEIAKDA